MTIFWIIVTLLAAVVEMATQQLVSTWFAVGGFVALVLAGLQFSVPVQVIGFFIVSAFCFVFVRRYITPYMQVKFVPTNVDRLIGQEAIVTRELPARGRGEVKINGQFWTARSDDPELAVEVDRSVIIRAIEGSTMIVSPIEED